MKSGLMRLRPRWRRIILPGETAMWAPRPVPTGLISGVSGLANFRPGSSERPNSAALRHVWRSGAAVVVVRWTGTQRFRQRNGRPQPITDHRGASGFGGRLGRFGGELVGVVIAVMFRRDAKAHGPEVPD